MFLFEKSPSILLPFTCPSKYKWLHKIQAQYSNVVMDKSQETHVHTEVKKLATRETGLHCDYIFLFVSSGVESMGAIAKGIMSLKKFL